jgi:hypothetical protein
MIEDNLGVDVRGSTWTYQKPYPPHFDILPVLESPTLLNSMGKITKAPRSILASIELSYEKLVL